MKKQVSLKKNFIMNALLTMSSFIFPLVTFPYVSRILLPGGTGRVQVATSLITYFSMFAQLGIPTYGIKVCATVRDDKDKLSRTAQELLIINLITSVFAYAVFFAALFVIPKMSNDKPLYIIISSTILLNALGMEWLYKALEEYSYITKRSILFKFVALVFMFLLIHEQSDYVMYGAISIFAASASNVLNLVNVRKHISFRKFEKYDFKRHMKPIAVYFAMSCATTIYLNLDSVMLGFMKGDVDTGYYTAAVKIKTILVSIVTSLGTVLLPRASYYYENNLRDEFYKITKKAMNFVIFLAVPLMVYFIVFADAGILLISGEEYYNSIMPMKIIMPTLLFIGMTNVMGIQVLVPMGKEKYVLYSEIAGAIVDLLLNIIFIPRLASSGAALGTTVAEAVVFVVQFILLGDVARRMFAGIQYGKFLAANAISLAAAFAIRLVPFNQIFNSVAMNSLIELCCSAILFFGLYALVLFALKEPMTSEIKDVILNYMNKKGKKLSNE